MDQVLKEAINDQFELAKNILGPIIATEKELTQLLKETQIRETEIKNFTEKLAATKISQAYKSYKSAKILNAKKTEASIKISQAYKSKLGLVEANKAVAAVLCKISSTQDIYRAQINDLLISLGTPKKLSSMYFYFCKFGSKILGYPSTKAKVHTIIEEIVGCVFLNTSFASTNFNGITFRQSKFINAKGMLDFSIARRSAKYLTTTKTKYDFTTDKFIFQGTNLFESRFLDCQFYNIDFGHNNFFDPTNLLINNIVPTFKNCTFTDGSITKFCLSVGPKQYVYAHPPAPKYNIKYHFVEDFDGYVSPKNSDMINPDGSAKINIVETEKPAEIVFEDCKFIKTQINNKYLEMPGDRNMKFINCIFKGNLFEKEHFNYYHFKKCDFRNVAFITCHLSNSFFEECTFFNTRFEGVKLCKNSALRFSKCIMLECYFSCTFTSGLDYKKTVLFDNNTRINNSIFRRCFLSNFKFNSDSEYNSRSSKLLNMKNNEFINCSLYGTNFDNCDLEGTKFSARIADGNTILNRFNWFGNIFFIFERVEFNYGEDKTLAFKKLCNANNPNGFELFLNEFRGAKLDNKFFKSNITSYFALMDYSEYSALNIDVRNFKKPEYNINPYDYFVVNNERSRDYVYIAPATSMFNANIKNCNFQEAEGLETFDFTQVQQNSQGKPDITASNFSVVSLLKANFNGCKMLGTVFDVADVTGVDFRNSIVNENTSFENTLNTDQVLGQIQREDGSVYIQGSLNLSTGREFQFSEIQQRANETHARVANIIDNKEKLFEALANMTIPIHDDDASNFSKVMKEFLIKCHDGKTEFVNHIVIDETKETIVDFLAKLVTIYKKIITTQTNLPENEDKQYIRNYFASALTNYFSYKLRLDSTEKTELLTNLTRAVNDDFLKYLLMFKTHLNGNWCFLQLVTNSLQLLFSFTDLYIYNFLEYYFNEIFNAHGEGSPSCPLGMVERWVTIHSQVLEAYLMLLRKSEDDLQKLDKATLNKLRSYSRNNTRDPKITKAYIEEFNNSESNEKIHNKYIFNKLINILKPHSKLPEDLESDIGFDLDYNISIAMTKDCNRRIKSKIDDGSLKTLHDIYEAFNEIMPKLIIANNNITQEQVDALEADKRPRVIKAYKTKKDALYKHVREREGKPYIIVLCMDVNMKFDTKKLDFNNLNLTQEELKMEDLVGYYDDQTTGGSLRNRRTSRSAKRSAIRSARSIRNAIKTKKSSLEINKSTQQQSTKSSLVPKAYTLIEQIIINTLKSLSLEEFENINIMPLDNNILNDIDTIVTSKSDTLRRAKSNPELHMSSKLEKTLSKQSKSSTSASTSISIASLLKSNSIFIHNFNYRSINYKNININNKPYIDLVRRRHNKIHQDHLNMLNVIELYSGIRLKEKVSTKSKRLAGTLKKKSFTKKS